MTSSVAGGSLTIVGSGIDAHAHLTPEARRAIQAADQVLYLVSDPVTAALLEELNATSRSLDGHYGPTKPRHETYAAIAEELLAPPRAGVRLCAVFYGHPAIAVTPSHRALELARAEGIPAQMLPAISALDCLVADLGIDPVISGLCSFEATALLLQHRRPDPESTVIIWQPAAVGVVTNEPDDRGPRIPVLVEYLCRFYPSEHETIVYMASPYSIVGPSIRRVPLRELEHTPIHRAATLVLPPLATPKHDHAMLARLTNTGSGEQITGR